MTQTVNTPAIATSFRWLRHGKEGLEAMRSAIAGARSSVRLEMYIFDQSSVALAILHALIETSQRRVRVRVLVDAIGSIELPDSFWDGLRQAGGEVRWFNPLTLGRISYRNHRKLLVVDDHRALIGGFNIADEYDGDGIHSGWRDLGLRISGRLALELGRSFDQMFKRADFKHHRLHQFRGQGLERRDSSQQCHLLLSGPGRGHRLLTRALAHDFAHASQIDIMSGYFTPPWRLRWAMRRAARRGGQVRLLVGATSDVKVAQLACRHLYQSLLRAGVEVYEYQPQILHAKLVIADNVVYAGSANLDVRGFGINYELLVRVTNPKLASEGRSLFVSDLTRSRRIDPATWRQSRGFLEKIMESWCYFFLFRVDPYWARWQWRRFLREL